MFFVITLLCFGCIIKLYNFDVIRLRDKNYYAHKVPNTNNHVSYI